MKVSELKPPELDYWVGKAEGWIEERFVSRGGEKMLSLGDPARSEGQYRGHFLKEGDRWVQHTYCPSTDWSQGGPIIEREWIELMKGGTAKLIWRSHIMDYSELGKKDGKPVKANLVGPTPLIAAMRAFVCSKFGEIVDEK